MYNTCQTLVLRQECQRQVVTVESVFPWPVGIIVGGVVGMWILKEIVSSKRSSLTELTCTLNR